MINSKAFANRLGKILDYYELSASSFAEKVDVGRSSISHILSGRNKPSLDFIMKTLQAFPEINLYWLMNGKGSFKHQESSTAQSSTAPPVVEKKSVHTEFDNNPVFKTTKSEGTSSSHGKEIHKVIILYKDGSFESFENI